MLVLSWQELCKNHLDNESALSCGVFDGVHRGHRALLNAVTSRAPLSSVVLSFIEHPHRVLHPESGVFDIITKDEKCRRLAALGIEIVVFAKFDKEFSSMNGDMFLDTLINSANMRFFALGQDFRCGKGGAFDSKDVQAYCAVRGVECCIIPPVLDAGEKISSTRIRAALKKGDTATAQRLLG